MYELGVESLHNQVHELHGTKYALLTTIFINLFYYRVQHKLYVFIENKII